MRIGVVLTITASYKVVSADCNADTTHIGFHVIVLFLPKKIDIDIFS